MGWLVIGYDKPNGNTMRLQHHEVGGSVESLVAHLDDSSVQHCLVRLELPEIEQRVRTRDVHITWIGSKVNVIQKGR